LSVVAPALPVLASIIQQSNDQVKIILSYCYDLYHNHYQSTIVDATWALSYISDGDNSRIQAVIDYGIITISNNIIIIIIIILQRCCPLSYSNAK
jgi:hypothetical protein